MFQCLRSKRGLLHLSEEEFTTGAIWAAYGTMGPHFARQKKEEDSREKALHLHEGSYFLPHQPWFFSVQHNARNTCALSKGYWESQRIQDMDRQTVLWVQSHHQGSPWSDPRFWKILPGAGEWEWAGLSGVSKSAGREHCKQCDGWGRLGHADTLEGGCGRK